MTVGSIVTVYLTVLIVYFVCEYLFYRQKRVKNCEIAGKVVVKKI